MDLTLPHHSHRDTMESTPPTTTLVDPIITTMAHIVTTHTFPFWGASSAQNISHIGKMNTIFPFMHINPLTFHPNQIQNSRGLPIIFPSDLLGRTIPPLGRRTISMSPQVLL